MRWTEEDQIHIEIIDWLEAVLPRRLVFHVANERGCSYQMGAKLKRMGVLPGVPDIEVLLPKGVTIRIEVKASKGVMGPAQKTFATAAEDLGHPCIMARSVDDVRRAFRRLGIQTREVLAA